jgi:hypothetical protein
MWSLTPLLKGLGARASTVSQVEGAVNSTRNQQENSMISRRNVHAGPGFADRNG